MDHWKKKKKMGGKLLWKQINKKTEHFKNKFCNFFFLNHLIFTQKTYMQHIKILYFSFSNMHPGLDGHEFEQDLGVGEG